MAVQATIHLSAVPAMIRSMVAPGRTLSIIPAIAATSPSQMVATLGTEPLYLTALPKVIRILRTSLPVLVMIFLIGLISIRHNRLMAAVEQIRLQLRIHPHSQTLILAAQPRQAAARI